STVSHVTVISVSATGDGNVEVDFYVDGAFLGTDTTAPYSMSWDTTVEANGSHTLTAVATDGPGNSQTSDPVDVTTLNPAFINEVVVPGITSATTMAFLPDRRML